MEKVNFTPEEREAANAYICAQLTRASEEMRIAGEKLLELSADQEAQAIAEARRLALWERDNI